MEDRGFRMERETGGGGGEWGCLGASPMPVKSSQMEGIGGLSYCVQKGYTAPWASVSPPVCDGSISSSSRLISSTPTFLWRDPFPPPLALCSAVGSPAPEAGRPPAAAGSPNGSGKGGWAAGGLPACTQ